jgi:hypothetical protein
VKTENDGKGKITRATKEAQPASHGSVSRSSRLVLFSSVIVSLLDSIGAHLILIFIVQA